MSCSLRERKIEALKCMLNFNAASGKEDEPQWKLLIYDRIGQDIIAPLFSVKELRSVGVTLHLLLDIKREPIPDVPADFEADLYSSYYLNFISPISRENLESLAETALTEDCIQRIKKVYDQYTRFICLEDDLFVLNEQPSNQEGTFYALNKTSCNEEDILRTIGFIVDSLYSVFATLGTVPIIRCSRFNAAEAVAKDLDNRFRESLRDSRNTLFSGMEHRAFNEAGKNGGASAVALTPFSFQRPLLIILDRVLDLATPLHHAWTYQSLLHDIAGIHLNRVEMGTQNSVEAEDVRQTKMKRYDLTTSTDRIWRIHRASPFSDVAGALQEELSVLQDREKKLGALKTSVAEGQTFSTNGTVGTDATSALTSTINTLPQLMEQKRCVDMHMHIATSLAKEIKNRQLDLLNDVEEKLITLQSLQEHSLPDLLKMECFSSEDKLRLLLIAALSCNSASTGSGSGGGGGGANGGGGGVSASSSSIAFNLANVDLDRYGEQLKAANPDLDISAIRYVHQLRRIARFSQAGTSTGTPGAVPEAGKSSTGRTMFNKLVSHGSAMFLEGMRVLSGRKSYFPFTQIVSQLVENKSEMEDYSYFDPKLHKRTTGGAASVPRAKQPFYDVYVFVVGGGTYTEYHNLLQWSRSGTTPGGASGSGGLGGGGTHGSSSSLNALGLSLSGSGTSMVDLPTSGATSITACSNASARRITYGGTEILTPRLFLDQLTRLGRET
ncbi:Sec1 family domain-containing protein 1 [Taenia crassiceps]|uniref:Sec1 family domain-containing protein 1 n=1 Tax=Taenia crassiceps TaxID=6207 RepID=A0ABR4QTJ7_9CEST